LHRATKQNVVSGTDMWALKHNKISVTPLRFNRGEYNFDFVNEMVPVIAKRILNKNK